MQVRIRLKGHTSEQFTNPCFALEAFVQGKFDVVITDLKLPGMNGLEVMKEIKVHNPSAYVIIMTGYSLFEEDEDSWNESAYAFFPKPLELLRLMKTLVKIEEELKSAGAQKAI